MYVRAYVRTYVRSSAQARTSRRSLRRRRRLDVYARARIQYRPRTQAPPKRRERAVCACVKYFRTRTVKLFRARVEQRENIIQFTYSL